MRINIENEQLEVQVTRSHRKTWEIRITPEGSLHVRGPLKVSEKKLLELLQSKADWILNKLESLRKRQSVQPGRKFANGDTYPYGGREFPLQISWNPHRSTALVRLTEGVFDIAVPEGSPEMIRTALEKWCHQQARQILPDRLRDIEVRMGLKCRRVTVKDQKKRWGSCSSLGNVNLNWRLILMPPDVMDSIIIHELAHLVHPNHSAEYYRYLGQHNPEYKRHDRWLKEQGRKLFI